MNISLDLDDLEKNYPNLIYESSPRTTINVSGHFYEIYTAILDAYPETLLGDSERREKYRSDSKYPSLLFFQRHPTLFSYILFYYIQGFVRRPINIPRDVFLEECRFFAIPIDIDEDDEENSVGYYSETNFSQSTMTMFHSDESMVVRGMHWFGFLVTIVACIVFFIDDAPVPGRIFSEFKYGGKLVHNFVSSSVPLTLIDMSCATWFMIEFFTRFFLLSNHHGSHQIMEFFIDIISILPVFLTIMTSAMSQWFSFTGHLVALCICLKAFRVVRFILYIPGLRLIVETLIISLNEISIALVLCSIAIIPFGTTIYIMERDDPQSNIVDPSIGLWWAIETLTTIGFGEHVPHTFEGRFLSIIACLLGLIILAMPIPMIFKKFQTIYQTWWKRQIWTRYR